jgi:hypothetical protein
MNGPLENCRVRRVLQRCTTKQAFSSLYPLFIAFCHADTLYISARGAQVVGCAITTVAIATFIVALRFITRSRLLKFVGREDWCIGIALVCNGHLNELHKNVLTGKKSFSPLEIPWV